MSEYNFVENKIHSAFVLKKNDKAKLVAHDGGISISDEEVTEQVPCSVLHLQSSKSGLLLPRVTEKSMDSLMKKAIPGTIVYNKTTDVFYGKTRKGWSPLNGYGDFRAPMITEKDKLLGLIKPVPGMIIYNKDYHRFEGYSGKKWIKII